MLGAGLAGCSAFGLPFGPDLSTRVSNETTGAIPVSLSVPENVSPSDWETVRNTVAAIPVDRAGTVEWTNPATGSTGSLTAVLVGTVQKAAMICRQFSTTVSDPHGIRRYRGQACRSDGRWDLSGVAPDDTTL
jgi:surface antigen